MEGPTVMKWDGVYYLFYSANHFMNIDYSVGYATASSPFGPWKKHPNSPIIHRSLVGENGTGHGDVFKGLDGKYYYVYHVHRSDSTVSPRKTRIVPLILKKGNDGIYNITACILTTEREREVDFATICNSPMDFNLQSPERLGKNLRNCWCEGKRLEGLTSSSEAEDVERLFPNYYSNKTTFLILSETDEAQKAIIDKVKDGKMVELSTDAFAGMDIKRRDIRTFKKDETTKDESIFEVGSVIAFKTPHKGDKIGIMRILSIGVDFTQDSAWNNENATITFDLYYQK